MYEENHKKDNDRDKTSDEFNYERVSKIPDGITRLKHHAKWRNDKVASNLEQSQKIIFPYTLKSTGEFAFCSWKGFASLIDVEFNEGLEEIGDGTFSDCYNLGKYKTIELPSTLKKIGHCAFYNCYNLHIKLNEGLKEIGDFAFNFGELDDFYYYSDDFPQREFFLPSSVEKVGKDIVDGKVRGIAREEKRIRTLI